MRFGPGIVGLLLGTLTALVLLGGEFGPVWLRIGALAWLGIYWALFASWMLEHKDD
jgi:hypothetical protein